MSDCSSARGFMRRCTLLCFAVCLCLSLSPELDFDLDGMEDSFLTEGVLLNAAIPSVVVPVFLLGGLMGPQVPSAALLSPPLLPPPIV